MPKRIIYSSTDPNYIPLSQWIDNKIAEHEANGDIESADAIRQACNENGQAMANANISYTVENDNTVVIDDIITPTAFGMLHWEWVDTYSVEVTVEEI